MKIIILGASGNIGSAVVNLLAMSGPDLVLIDRGHRELMELRQSLLGMPASIHVLSGDLGSEATQLAQNALQLLGEVDLVINCAGQEGFHTADAESATETAKLFSNNVIGPIQFINALLPHMMARGKGHIVNTGSILGALAFPCFATYSASKAALRYYSEALRREVAASGIQVHYVATRYIRARANSAPLACFASLMKLPYNYPTEVAWQILDAIEHRHANSYPGWQERLLAWLNALFPTCLDHFLRPVTAKVRPLTTPSAASTQPSPLEKI